MKQFIAQEKQQQIREKELKKEQNREEAKRIKEFNRKAEYIIIKIKDKKRLNATYNIKGINYRIENNLGELAVKNKKTG